ncbi:metallophosphoesterase family protein [Candidatus Nitrosocosmicus sp. T]
MTESTLPLLLAGPMIRRVDKTQVCIWIATSKSVNSKVEIFRKGSINGHVINKKDDNKDLDKESKTRFSQLNMHIIGNGNDSSLKLGENLHVSLIIARPFSLTQIDENKKQNLLSTFPTDEILAYDLELFLSHGDKEKGLRLKDLGLLSGENTILYENSDFEELPGYNVHENKSLNDLFALPTFYIPVGKSGSQLNVIYGSCRKLHGDDEDNLILGDKLVGSSISDLKKRPSCLFLIGDQIYADGVSGPLIGYLSRLGTDLLGWRENIDGIDSNLEDIPIGGRKQIVNSKSQFSSGVSDNHLLGFGEFAAMYLVAWNPLLWPREFGSNLVKLHPSSKLKQKYEKELRELEQSRKIIRKVRRLLANTPTYMICDDHEITDDWNIDQKWSDSVKNSINGSQIIVNGLIAYWAFQGWGNDPNSFNDDFIEIIKEYLDLRKQKSLLNLKKTYAVSNLDYDSGRINKGARIRMLEDQIWNLKKWIYVAPTYPPSIFLDCRTQREFVNPDGPPILLNDEALNHIKKIVYASGYVKGDPLVIISPTPVFGFELAESVQRFLTSISGTYKWDLETWRANEAGFIKFLAFLSNTFSPDYCIILSGDVHYAFTMKARFDIFTPSHHPNQMGLSLEADDLVLNSIHAAQLTSSPLRSNSVIKRKAAIMILNLAHKIIITKKNVTRSGFMNTNNIQSYSNHGNVGEMIENGSLYKKNSLASSISQKENKNYSKHPKGTSFLFKIRTVFTSLINRYFIDKQSDSIEQLPKWGEYRMLVTPKGYGITPVLASNNIGSVSLNLKTRTVVHTLFYLKKNKVRSSVAVIEFDATKKDTL